MKKLIERLLLFALAAALALAGGLTWYARQPLSIEGMPRTVNVTPGMHLRSLSVMLAREGVVGNATLFWLLGRVTGQGTALKVGVYTLDRPLTPLELYGKIERGEVSQAIVQFIEGWSWREVRAALAAQPLLKHDSANLDEAALLRALGAEEPRVEGLLFPDTYYYAPHSSEVEVLRRAYRLQRDKLRAAWEGRAPGLPYKTPYEALIMASIVE